MKQLLYTAVILLFSLTSTTAQDNHSSSFCERIFASCDHYELHTKKLKSFTVHVVKSQKKGKKPLLLYIQGSTPTPLYYSTKSGNSTGISLDVNRYADDYHVVLISKPDIPICDSLKQDEDGRLYYPSNELYKNTYSLDSRAESASYAIDFLLKKLSVDQQKVIVMGYSEGAQVAPRVAVLNKKVTHLVCFVGNTLNHFYNFIIEARLQAAKGVITHNESQRVVDSLYNEYEKIYADPKSTTKEWYGDTYLKWASFCKTTPLESMLSLDIPILYVAGAKDNNQSIIDIDYAYLEFLRKGKRNLTYKVYPNCDHYFREEIIANDGTTKTENHGKEVHQYALDWVNKT